MLDKITGDHTFLDPDSSRDVFGSQIADPHQGIPKAPSGSVQRCGGTAEAGRPAERE